MLEIRVPKELELLMKKDETIRNLIKKRIIEERMTKELIDELFAVMLFDDLLKENKLSQEDVEEIDKIVKKGIMEKLRIGNF